LDYSERNTRVFRNRFTNVNEALSFQPIFGGPVYAVRNVVVNVGKESLKFHNEPSGMLVLHNTFVRAGLALDLGPGQTSHHFLVANNLFVARPATHTVVLWNGPIDDGLFDWNGWFPDGKFDFGAAGSWPTFAGMRAAGVFEAHGVLLDGDTFASGLVPPDSYQETLPAEDTTLAGTTAAVHARLCLANLNATYPRARPALGALALRAAVALFAPRPEGVDERNEPIGCEAPVTTCPTTTRVTTTVTTTSGPSTTSVTTTTGTTTTTVTTTTVTTTSSTTATV